MLTLNNIEKKEALDKPFTNIRFVVDPPEGIKALGIKLKEPTLFVEVVHGKGTDVLKEWILLHLKHELKTPVDQKTRYGKKIELKDLNDSGLESASPKRDFDLQQIENYLYPRTQRNKLIPSIRSAPGSTTSDRATLCIPTSSGECRLVFTPEGNVCLDRVPTDLDLKIETPGSIKTGADLKCYSVCLVGKNIQNAYSFEADTMNITAEKKLINEGKLSGKNAVVVSAGEALINQPNAILISENGLMQIKDTPHLTNQGEIHGAKQLEISTPTCLNNASKGTLTSDLHLNLSLSASHNHGQMSARTIVLSGAALENSTEGKILGDNIHIVGNTVLDNSGRVKAKQALSIKTNTNLTNNAKGTLKAGTDLTLNVQSVVNAGIVESTKTLVADLKETLENQVSGRIISKENLVLKSETIQNSGKVRAEGSATCEAGKIIQTLKSSEMRSEKQLLLDAKTKVENAGVLYGKESANITAGEVLTNKPDANLETNGMLTVATPFLDNAAKIKGQTMTSAGMAKLNNQGDVVFQESLKLGKIGVVENTGSITTPGSLYLETRLLQHTETAELSATTGVLTLQGDNYNAGKIITQDVILKTGSFENTITGILQAETLNATAANIDNAGKIQSKESFSVSEASFVKNKKGGLLAANNLTLSAITLENQGDLQGDTVAVTTTTRLEQEGTVTAETLTLTAPGIENHSTGVVKATQLTLNSVEVVNAGALKAKNLLLPQTKHLQNRGDINVDALNATLLQQLDNHATITIAEKGAVVSVQLNNRGVFKGGKRSHVKIQTRRCENQGELVFGTLGLDAEVLKNLGTGKILAEKLDANIKEVNNQGILGSVADCTAETLTLGGVANITASQFNNSGTLLAGDLICNTQNETGLYGFNNQGIVRTKAFHFTGKGISHTAGSLTVENMVITGRNIQLIATTESPGNIKLQHEGGIWEISDKHVKCSGELIFYWPEGRVVTQSWDALGSLKYSLSAGATQPLSFMANQTAETGHFSAVAPTPIIVGAAYQVVDATLRPSTLVSLIGKTAILKGSELQVPRGIVIGIEGVVLESQTDITLGQLYGSHSKTFPELASIQSAVKSRGEIVMKANNNHHWFQLEMEGGADFRLTGQFLDNVSSDIVIKNDAYLDAPLSQHRLLVDRDPGGYRVSWGGWNCHDFYKTQNASAKPLSNPAKFSIGGTLSYTGKMKIFGSQASCSVRVGSSLPELENFIPFTSFTESSLCGHEKRSKSRWYHNISVINYTPFLAACSQASDLVAIASRLELSGIYSAYSVRISGIEEGRLGQFSDSLNLQLAPTSVIQFRSDIPLLEHFTSSLLYNMSAGGDMVFKSLLKDPTPPCFPRLLLQKDGSLNFDTQNLRRLFTPQQEERCLTNLMMTEFGRHFLSPAVSGAGSIMRYLENNTLSYHQQGKKLIENLETTLAEVQHSGALTVQSSNIAVPFRLDKPCIADAVVTLIRKDGTREQVTCPTIFFPESFNNRRLQDGAGCLFSLGEIYLAGGGRLHIRGNLDAGGLVTYENFQLVEHVRNTYTHYEAFVAHETKSKNLMGKTKKTQQLAQVAVIKLQHGAQVLALGERYINVKNVHFKGALMLLGTEGLSITGADFVLDEAIIQNQPGALLSKKQTGCLGLGGSTISSQVVLQRAMGSVIQTPGRIHIEAKTGVFQATLFGDENGNKKVAEFEISELDYHGLLKAVEEENRLRTQAINASLAEQARTSKRKATQSTTRLLVSLPIIYYTGGFLSKYLAGTMGVTLSTATVAGTATAAQTATIVGLSGAGAAAAGAVVQGNNPIEAAANGAFYAWLGNVVANASVLKNSAQITQAVARSTVVATAQTVIKGGNLLENVAVAGAAAAVAAAVFPGDPRDLSLTANIAKNMLEAAVVTVASNGSLEALAVNSANAGLGAMIGESASDLGGEHGARAANASGPTARSNAQSTTASLSSSVSGASFSARATAATPQRPQPARSIGLGGNDFNTAHRRARDLFFDAENDFNTAHRRARDLFFDAEMECSNHTTRGFWKMPAENNAFEMKDLFDAPPVLLWSAPNRFNRFNRASEHTFHSRSTAAQDSRQSEESRSNQYLDGLGQGATSVLDMIVGAAELSALSSAMEQNGSALMPMQSGFGAMTLRALFGDQSPEIIAWQQQNRSKAPIFARESDALQEVKPLQVAKSFGRGIKDSFVETGEFLGEEAARFRLGEKTKIGSIVNAMGTFLGEEAARVTLHEETQTERFARVVDTFVHEETARFRLGEETKTQALIFNSFQKLCQMRAEELTHYVGKGAGDILTGYGIARGLKLTYKAAGRGVSAFPELREFAAERTFRSPIVLEYDPNTLYSGFPLNLFKPQKPWVKKDILSETARLHPSPLFKHEETIIAQWTVERLRLLEKWKAQDLSAVNEKMNRFLDKCYSQLRDHMTPDDLAAIMKEQRGVKIFKEEGSIFDHFGNEWKQAQKSFKNAFNGPKPKSLIEEQIVNERFGDISRMWTTYREMIERAKCNPETKKLNFSEKP